MRARYLRNRHTKHTPVVSGASIMTKATFGLGVPLRLIPSEAEAVHVSLIEKEAIEIQETIGRRRATIKMSVVRHVTAGDRTAV